ncbi:type IV pilus biogenesis protein PilM [Terribacillus saccharophilus]|uniref:type IV pilus biogenesis protein PilM n=1 Tax=Terribacillus saccharophilus TaxID=361277 RepID=UPI002DC75EF8|nr:pilus assembly protein PilM [Terribacillus saccharophilus]
MFKKQGKQVYIIIQETVLRYIAGEPAGFRKGNAYGSLELPQGTIRQGILEDREQLTKAVRKLVEENSWRGRDLMFTLPDQAVTLRQHQVPKQLKREEIKPFLYTELEHTIQLPFEDPVLDFEVLEEGEGSNTILLVAYPGKRVEAYQQAFKEAGLQPIAADLASLTLYRLYIEQYKETSEDHLLLLQWNRSGLILTAFHQDMPLFIRQPQTSFGNLQDHMEQDLFYQEEADRARAYLEEQLTEIERFMDFYRYSVMNGEAGITKLLVSGDYENLSDVMNELRQRLQIETVTFRQEMMDELPLAYADVLGLSMKKL